METWIDSNGEQRESNVWYPMNPYPFVRETRFGKALVLPLKFDHDLNRLLFLKFPDGSIARWGMVSKSQNATHFGVFVSGWYEI